MQIDISSVHGTNNVFYRRRMAGEEWRLGIIPIKGKTRVFIFDWKDHPGKTQAWYDQRRARNEAESAHTEDNILTVRIKKNSFIFSKKLRRVCPNYAEYTH